MQGIKTGWTGIPCGQNSDVAPQRHEEQVWQRDAYQPAGLRDYKIGEKIKNVKKEADRMAVVTGCFFLVKPFFLQQILYAFQGDYYPFGPVVQFISRVHKRPFPK